MGGGANMGYPQVNVIGGDVDAVVLPEKPKKRRKIMEVQKETKYTMHCLEKNQAKNQPGGTDCNGVVPMDEDDAEEEEEEEKEQNQEPKKIPWGPPELMNHLKEPGAVENINMVLQLLKKTSDDEFVEDGKQKGKNGDKNKKGQPVEIVWDHSKTPTGKKSDNNFFIWMEAMVANEAKKVMHKENLIFE